MYNNNKNEVLQSVVYGVGGRTGQGRAGLNEAFPSRLIIGDNTWLSLGNDNFSNSNFSLSL